MTGPVQTICAQSLTCTGFVLAQRLYSASGAPGYFVMDPDECLLVSVHEPVPELSELGCSNNAGMRCT